MMWIEEDTLLLWWLADRILEEAESQQILPVVLLREDDKRRKFLRNLESSVYVSERFFYRAARIARDFAHHRKIEFGCPEFDEGSTLPSNWELDACRGRVRAFPTMDEMNLSRRKRRSTYDC